MFRDSMISTFSLEVCMEEKLVGENKFSCTIPRAALIAPGVDER